MLASKETETLEISFDLCDFAAYDDGGYTGNRYCYVLERGDYRVFVGKNVRDWLYVEDLCKAIDLVVREGKEGEVYNVGGHNEETNLEIVKLTIATIRKLMTEKPEYRQVLKKKVKGEDGEISVDWINNDLITFVKDRLGHDQRYAIDPTKITNALGWYPETKFEDGIVKTIVWYLENQDWVEEVTSGDYQGYYEKMYGK